MPATAKQTPITPKTNVEVSDSCITRMWAALDVAIETVDAASVVEDIHIVDGVTMLS